MTRLKLALVDGNYMLHRALHTKAYQEMQTSEGVCTGGVLGSFMTVRHAVMRYSFDRVIVVWDGAHSVRRKKLLPMYKVRDGGKSPKQRSLYEAHRDLFAQQEKWVWRLLPLMGAWQMRLANREADDVIAFMVYHLTGHDVTVVSDDKDMLQLVTPTVSVARPIKGDVVAYDNFRSVIGVGRAMQLLRLVAAGDAIDRIPGVAGERTVHRVTSILDAWFRADGIDTMDLPKDDCEWGGLLGQMVQVCELLGRFDKRNRRFYERLASATTEGGDIHRNVELIDLRREEFSLRERGILADYTSEAARGTAIVTEPQKDFMKMLQHFHVMEARNMVEHWGSILEPLRNLT